MKNPVTYRPALPWERQKPIKLRFKDRIIFKNDCKLLGHDGKEYLIPNTPEKSYNWWTCAGLWFFVLYFGFQALRAFPVYQLWGM